ncbi:hypothetical protein [Mycobacterium colombiense]|uniref:hypothetical protein n=1 Tax=Mycobacterium colombiense TaxID=339268 RepID=UPI003204741D
MELAQTPLSLPAVEPEWFREVISDRSLVADMAHAVGGPFHVLFAPQFARNLKAFTDVLDSAGVEGQVFFAKKANKAGCCCASARSSAQVSMQPAPRNWFMRLVAVCAVQTSWSPGPPKANICSG